MSTPTCIFGKPRVERGRPSDYGPGRVNEHMHYAYLDGCAWPPSLGAAMRYRAWPVPSEGGTLYLAQHETGIVEFLWHDPKHEAGYGGTTFTLLMDDNSVRYVKGPWSSNPGAVYHYTGVATVHVEFPELKRAEYLRWDLWETLCVRHGVDPRADVLHPGRDR